MSAPAQKGRSALVFGGTGLVGGHLLALLLGERDWSRIVAVTRRPLGLQDPRFAGVIANPGELAAHREALRADVVFCALGTTQRKAGTPQAFRAVDHDYVLEAGTLAHAAGARVFAVVSSLGADPASSNFYLRVKGETERDLRALGLPTLHILQPSLILGERDERRPLEALAQRAAPWAGALLVGPLRRYRPITAEQVARALRGVADDTRPGTHVHAGESLMLF